MTLFIILIALAGMLAGVIGNIVASRIEKSLQKSLQSSTHLFIFLVSAMVGLVVSAAVLSQITPAMLAPKVAPTAEPTLTQINAATSLPLVSASLSSSSTATSPPTSILQKATPEVASATIGRRLSGPNEYFIRVPDTGPYKIGDLLVVYARDPGAELYVYGVMSVMEKTPENLLARLIFQKPNIEVTTLSPSPPSAVHL